MITFGILLIATDAKAQELCLTAPYDVVYADPRPPTSTTIVDIGTAYGSNNYQTQFAWPYTPWTTQTVCGVALDFAVRNAGGGSIALDLWQGGSSPLNHLQSFSLATSSLLSILDDTSQWSTTNTLFAYLNPCVSFAASSTYWLVMGVKPETANGNAYWALGVNYSALDSSDYAILWCRDKDSLCTGEPGASAGSSWWPYSAFGTSDYYSPTWHTQWLGEPDPETGLFSSACVSDYGITSFNQNAKQGLEYIFQNKLPFAWWYSFSTAFQSVTSTTGTTEIALPAFGAIPTTTIYESSWTQTGIPNLVIPWIHEVLTVMLWVGTIAYLVNRLRTIDV